MTDNFRVVCSIVQHASAWLRPAVRRGFKGSLCSSCPISKGTHFLRCTAVLSWKRAVMLLGASQQAALQLLMVQEVHLSNQGYARHLCTAAATYFS